MDNPVNDATSNPQPKRRYGVGQHPNSRANLEKKKFKKGQIANPIGANAHNQARKMLRQFSATHLREIIEIALMGNMAELIRLADIKKTGDEPPVKVLVARCLVKAINKGDWDLAEGILQRVIGKIPDKVEFSGSAGPLAGIKVEFVDPEPAIIDVDANVPRGPIDEGPTDQGPVE